MAPTTKLLVVLGATGAQGGSVLTSFLSDPNPDLHRQWRFRALTRDPTKPASLALSAKGVDVVRGDVSDPASLRSAFAGASAIFAVSDFWTNFFAILQHQKPGDRPANDLAGEMELQQAKNIFDAAAEVQGLERLVWSGLPSAEERSGGKYTKVYSFEWKARATRYLFEKHPDLAKKTNVVWVGMYAENHVTYPFFRPKKQPDNSFLFSFPSPPNHRLPYIVASTQTGNFVKPLLTSAEAGTTLRAFTANISIPQFAELWGETLGVTARYEQVTMEEYVRGNGVEEPLDRQLAETMAYHGEFGYWGWGGGDGDGDEAKDAGEIGIEVPGVEGIKEWIRSADWSAVLDAGAGAK